MRKIKNLDQFIVGTDAYDMYDGEWVTIKCVDMDNEECEVEGDMTRPHKVRMHLLCPNVEGARLKKNKNCNVCYNADEDIEKPYYSPDYNEYVGEDDVTYEVRDERCQNMLNHIIKCMARLFEAKYGTKIRRNNFIADYIRNNYGESIDALNGLMHEMETKTMQEILDDIISDRLIKDSKEQIKALLHGFDDLFYPELLKIYVVLHDNK